MALSKIAKTNILQIVYYSPKQPKLTRLLKLAHSFGLALGAKDRPMAKNMTGLK